MNNQGLCFRCEYRARYLEEGTGPRFECKCLEMSVVGCYMFQPVKPIVIKPREGDNRPLSLNYFSARVERAEISPDLELTVLNLDKGQAIFKGILVYWKPKEEKHEGI